MSKRMVAVAVLLAALIVAGVAEADVVVLKEHSGAGYTECDTSDTRVDMASTTYGQYNYGGIQNCNNLYRHNRAVLMRFDLDAIPDKDKISAISSATLRFYQHACAYTGGDMAAGQLVEDWVEGTAVTDGSVCDGAQRKTKNAGTLVDNADLGTYVHTHTVDATQHTFYTTDAPDLGDDPYYGPKKHVRRGSSNDLNNNDDHTEAASLDALADLGTTRGYYYDSAADTLYLNKNEDTRWYGTADYFATDGAGIKGDYIIDNEDPNPFPTGWREFTVTEIVENWLVDGDPNYGFRIRPRYATGSYSPQFAMSEMMDDYAGVTPDVDESLWRPELIIDYEAAGAPIPEPAGLGLLGLVLLGLRRRRR